MCNSNHINSKVCEFCDDYKCIKKYKSYITIYILQV